MSFDLPLLPDFIYFEVKAKNPINLAKALNFLQQTIDKGRIFESIEALFWTIGVLYRLDKLDLLNKESIKKYILELKHEEGGYKSSAKSTEPDIKSTFYCISCLKILMIEETIDNKDLAFLIKTFSKKISIEDIFYATSALILLNKLDKINKKPLLDLLKKDTADNIELIFQILNLYNLGEIGIFNLEKRLPVLTSWKISNSGFGINTNFPSTAHTFWVSICLELLKKLELIEYGSTIDFLKTMQQDDGGFTDQYTSISTKESGLISTAQALLCIFYIWNNLIEGIENQILKIAQDSPEIYLMPIAEKFHVSLDIVEEIANWLISNNWIEAKILNRQDLFENYFNQQPLTSKDIIKRLMNQIKSFEKKNEIDLNEFSKDFDFSNPLERVKLVANDLIINKFITGSIRTIKKKYILENFSLSEKYIYRFKPLPFNDIMNEKKQMNKDKQKLFSLRKKLIKTPLEIAKNIQEMIEKDKISEARQKLDKDVKSLETEVQNIEKLINEINSNYKFINFKLYNLKFEKNWSTIKISINESLSKVKSDLEDKIKQKEESIERGLEEVKEKEAIKTLNLKLAEITKKLDLYKIEVKNFFPKNYTNHEKTLELLNKYSKFIEESNSALDSQFSEIASGLQIEELKKELAQIKASWTKHHEQGLEDLNSYQMIINKRIELEKLITEIFSELHNFTQEKNEQITNLINENKLDESSNLINEAISLFNEVISKQNATFNEFNKDTTKDISDFSKFSSDINLKWRENFQEIKDEWENYISELKGKLHFSLELDRKEDLDKKLKGYIKDIKTSINDMERNVLDLVKTNDIINAEKKNDESFNTINNKIKSFDQDSKDYIKNSIREFKTFRETVKEVIENWELEREKLTNSLNEISNDLKVNIDKKGSELKKEELNELIKNLVGDLKSKITQFISNYNQIIESGKKITDSESKLEKNLQQIQNSLKSSENEIKDFIKTQSRDFNLFDKIIDDERNLWNNSKTSVEKQLGSISDKIDEEILIQKVQNIVSAFKENKIDLNYLSKAIKIKLEPLKLRLIDFISGSKLLGEFDSTSDIFFLKEERPPEKLIIEEEKPIKKEIEEEIDPIKIDILRLRYLMVIHNEVGASVYNRKLGDWTLDPELIGGFLSAIQSFGTEIKKKTIPLESMQYKEFQIVLEQGTYVLVALFIDEKESDWIREKVRQFVKEFETQFETALKDWQGELSAFKRAGLLVDKVFELFRV